MPSDNDGCLLSVRASDMLRLELSSCTSTGVTQPNCLKFRQTRKVQLFHNFLNAAQENCSLWCHKGQCHLRRPGNRRLFHIGDHHVRTNIKTQKSIFMPGASWYFSLDESCEMNNKQLRFRKKRDIWQKPLTKVTILPCIAFISTNLWRWTRASGLSSGHEGSAPRWKLASTVPQQQSGGAWRERQRGCWGPEWRAPPWGSVGSEGSQQQSEETLLLPWDWTNPLALMKLHTATQSHQGWWGNGRH